MHDIVLNVDTNGQFNLLHGCLVCCEWKCQLLITFGGTGYTDYSARDIFGFREPRNEGGFHNRAGNIFST